MAVRNQPQMALTERVVDDAELKGLLVKREEAKERRKGPNKVYKAAHEAVTGYLAKIETRNGELLRVGEYQIEVKDVDEAEVSFTRGAKRKFNIRLPRLEK